MHKPKKSLGQNFLKSPSVAKKLVSSANITEKDIVIEVGPGRGAITKHLVGRANKVIAIEKDERMAEDLKEKFEEEIKNGKLTIITGDILKINPKLWNLETGSWKLIGAIPYYITSRLLRTFLENKNQPNTIAFIIQKEVASRITGSPRAMAKGKESLLSLSVKVYGTPHYVQTIRSDNFSPKPKVDSAIIVIDNISKDFFSAKGVKDIPEIKFFELLRAGFSSKRKKLSSNIKKHFPGKNPREVFTALNIPQAIRAEDMSLAQWKKLFLALHNKD